MNGAVVRQQQVLKVIHEALVDQPVDAKHRNCRGEPHPHGGDAWPDDPQAGRKLSSFRRLKK
jgi:hypothetical protein